jgi:hypothetical protein
MGPVSANVVALRAQSGSTPNGGVRAVDEPAFEVSGGNVFDDLASPSPSSLRWYAATRKLSPSSGWPHDLCDYELLARLLALNLERAGKPSALHAS